MNKEMDEPQGSRSSINRHKGFGGLTCECCAGGRNGLRRRRKPPRYMLRALAQGKKLHYYPFHHYPLRQLTGEERFDDQDDRDYFYDLPGLSRWKRTLRRQQSERERETLWQ